MLDNLEFISSINYLDYIKYLVYNGSISYPYVSRLRIDGDDTMNDGIIPEDDIGI